MRMIYGPFVLLLILYLPATDSQGIICPSDQIRATDGEDVAFPCYLHDGRGVTLNQLVWWKFNGSHDVVVYRIKQSAHDDQAEQFRGRATIDRDDLDRGILTVKISSVKTTDDGTYTCFFKDGPQPPVSCNVRLTVDRPPIICSDRVTATVGEDVTLRCYLHDGREVTYNHLVWWKLNHSHTVVVYRRKQVAPSDQDEDFRGRATIDRNDLDRGILTVKIYSVNTTDGGTYTCSFRDGRQPPVSCNVDLSVAVKGSTDKNTEEKPGPVDTHEDRKITVGVIGGVVLVAVLAVGIWWWRRRKHPHFNDPSESVTAAVGENVTLPCYLHDGRDVRGKTVTWTFNDSHNVLVCKSRQIKFDDQADQFKDRATIDVPVLDRGDLGLTIFSVETADSGTYTCSLRDGPLSISWNVQLTVVFCPAKLRNDEETETLDQQEKQNLLSETPIPRLRKTSEHPLSQDLTPRQSEDQSLSEPDPNQ